MASFTTRFQITTAVALFSLALGLSACAFKKDGDKAPESAIETLQKQNDLEAQAGELNESNVVITFRELDTPDMYEMKITWPPQFTRMEVKVNDWHEDVISLRNFALKNVPGGKEHNIALKAYGAQGAPLKTHTFKARSPEDFVVRNLITLKGDTVYEGNRIFFEPGGKIVTNGFDLNIKFNSMQITQDKQAPAGASYHESAIILTRLPETIALEDRGLPTGKGARIKIDSKVAKGKLLIALVALNGRAGRSGAELETAKNISRLPDIKKTGSSGTPGTSLEAIPGPNCTMTDLLMPEGPCHFFLCQNQGSPGGQGQPGAQGTRGEQGGKAGDTDMVVLSIEDSSNLETDVAVHIGKPGPPGDGAQGFPGGPGGKAVTPAKGCNAQVNGAQGSTGANGLAGENGLPGARGEINLGTVKARVFDF